MKNMKKMMALMLALTLLVGVAVGGTIAWLADSTKVVKNTFTTGDVALTLKETPITVDPADGSYTYGETKMEGVTNAYPLIPGTTYKKDPVVEVTAGSENCWLFVKFEETAKAMTYLTYTSTLTAGNGWKQGDGTNIPANVWYRDVAKDDTLRSWNLLANDSITIKGDAVTKATMAEAKEQSLTYTAYAVQQDNLTAEEAWAKVPPAKT